VGEGVQQDDGRQTLESRAIAKSRSQDDQNAALQGHGQQQAHG